MSKGFFYVHHDLDEEYENETPLMNVAFYQNKEDRRHLSAIVTYLDEEKNKDDYSFQQQSYIFDLLDVLKETDQPVDDETDTYSILPLDELREMVSQIIQQRTDAPDGYVQLMYTVPQDEAMQKLLEWAEENKDGDDDE